MDSRRDFTSKKVFSGYFSELGEKANSALRGGGAVVGRLGSVHGVGQHLVERVHRLAAARRVAIRHSAHLAIRHNAQIVAGKVPLVVVLADNP